MELQPNTMSSPFRNHRGYSNWVVIERSRIEIKEDDEFVHQKPHRLHQTPHEFQKRGACTHQERKPDDLTTWVSQSIGEHWRCAGTARAKCGGGASCSPLGHKWLAPTPRRLSHIAPVCTYAQLKSIYPWNCKMTYAQCCVHTNI